jgi:hypothetical protein
MLDYPVGIVLIAAPWIFGFNAASNEAAYLVPIVIGAVIILQSLITDYEPEAIRSCGALHLRARAGGSRRARRCAVAHGLRHSARCGVSLRGQRVHLRDGGLRLPLCR